MQPLVVIGLGRFGARLAKNLAAAGRDVLAIDQRKSVIDDIKDHVTMAVAMDATDEDALRAQGVDQAEAAVVGIGADFEAAALITVTLKSIGVPRIVGRAQTRRGGRILERIGADQVVNPEDEAADRWAISLTSPHFLGHHALDEGYSIAEIKIPADWIGKTLSELNLRKNMGLLVVAIKKNLARPSNPWSRSVLHIIKPDYPFAEGDILIIIGADQDISRLPSS